MEKSKGKDGRYGADGVEYRPETLALAASHVSLGAWPNEKKIPIGQKSTFSFRFFSFSTG